MIWPMAHYIGERIGCNMDRMTLDRDTRRGWYVVLDDSGTKVLHTATSYRGAVRLATKTGVTAGWPCLIARVIARKTEGEALSERT